MRHDEHDEHIPDDPGEGPMTPGYTLREAPPVSLAVECPECQAKLGGIYQCTLHCVNLFGTQPSPRATNTSHHVTEEQQA
jgi:hypothetical protein